MRPSACRVEFLNNILTMAKLAVLGALLSACGPSKDLSRSTAASLIGKHAQFNAPRYERIFLGTDFRQADFMGVGNWEIVDALASLGYVESRNREIRLTAKGESACKNTPRDPERPDARLFQVATRELVEITGIADFQLFGSTGGAVKEVDFRWKWVPSPLGESLKNGPRLSLDYASGTMRAGKALCRLYDDGWRVEEFEGITKESLF